MQKRFSVFEAIALRVLPYFACFFFVELFYLVIKISFLYGAMIALIFGSVLFLMLSGVLLGCAIHSRIALITLVILCEIHAAITLGYLLVSPFGGFPSVPVWLFILRLVMLPCELLLAFSTLSFVRKRLNPSG